MNILITGAFCCTEVEKETLEKEGHNVLILKDESNELPCNYDWPECIVCNNLFLHHKIEKFTRLKMIQATSSGLDRIPLDYCEKNLITVKNARGVYSIPISEFVISGILDIYKQKRDFFKQQDIHLWNKRRSLIELYGKSVLIVGCGSIGFECAKRLVSFGCTVFGIDNNVVTSKVFKSVKSVDYLFESLSCADIVILSLPLTLTTRKMFGKKAFAYMNKNSILVNVSRGEILDENELIFNLKTKLLGAILDVFEQEPLSSDSVLWDLGNIIITPHNAFEGEFNKNRFFKVFLENLKGISKN